MGADPGETLSAFHEQNIIPTDELGRNPSRHHTKYSSTRTLLQTLEYRGYGGGNPPKGWVFVPQACWRSWLARYAHNVKVSRSKREHATNSYYMNCNTYNKPYKFLIIFEWETSSLEKVFYSRGHRSRSARFP